MILWSVETYLHNKRPKSGALIKQQKSIVASLHPAAALWQIFRDFCCSVRALTPAQNSLKIAAFAFIQTATPSHQRHTAAKNE